jgi:hypothetical protein
VGDRVEWAGVGRSLCRYAHPPEPDAIRAGVLELLSNSRFKERAMQLAQHIAMVDSAVCGAQYIELAYQRRHAVKEAA